MAAAQTARIGIALGDVTGIGPEVTFKALADAALREDETRYVLLGDRGWAEPWARKAGFHLEPYRTGDSTHRYQLLDPRSEALPTGLGAGAPEAARAALDWLAEGARRCLTGEFEALVTAPVSKEAILRAGVAFIGQTEFLAQLAGVPDPVMMLLGTDDRGRWLRVALATTHVPLARVAASLTEAKIRTAIQRAAEACARLGLTRRRVGVCGLNPHAGEGGALGFEDGAMIRPAVETARAAGVDAVGPLAADSLFHLAYRGDFDAVVAMYHDQGLAPLKMVAFETGVNWTLGLPFVRTSPDHGTAYELAGRDAASAASTISAITLARRLARRSMPRSGPDGRETAAT